MKACRRPQCRQILSPPCRGVERRTRSGAPCRRIGNARNGRCILHGGRAGAPLGQRNGAWRHGGATNEAKAQRKAVRVLLREARKMLDGDT